MLEELRMIKKLEKAKTLNQKHYQDTLHGILALKSGAEYIVTRNIKDFKQFEDKIKIVKPEFLL